MNTTENNKLIAEFMGGTPQKEIDPLGWWDIPDKTPHGYDVIMFDSMKYNSSWDWLMPVVEKIEKTKGANFRIVDCHCAVIVIKNDIDVFSTGFGDDGDFIDFKNKIEATHKAVVEFIKWFNQQKEK